VDLLQLIGGSSSMLVGTASATGEPRASRAWAAQIVGLDPLRVRVVMDADDAVAISNLREGASVALTGADVRTLRAVQLKGRVLLVEPASDQDRSLAADQSAQFFQAVVETDGNPIELLRRLLPAQVVSFELLVDERYDQSPGPTAGRPVEATA
jgi:hypothetical protein